MVVRDHNAEGTSLTFLIKDKEMATFSCVDSGVDMNWI